MTTPSSDDPKERSPRMRTRVGESLIPAGAALLGAVIAGVVTYSVTVTQLKAQTVSSQADFIRQERVSSYSAMISDTNRAEQFLDAREETLSPDRLANASDAATKMLDDLASIIIVGTFKTSRVAVQVSGDISSALTAKNITMRTTDLMTANQDEGKLIGAMRIDLQGYAS